MIDLQMGKVIISKYKNKFNKLSAGVPFAMLYNPSWATFEDIYTLIHEFPPQCSQELKVA